MDNSRQEIPPTQPVNHNGLSKNERVWGMFCHLGACAGLVIPFGNLIVPFAIWLVKKDEMPFVNEQGKESINFQITMIIVMIICGILFFAVVGVFLLPLAVIYTIVMVLIASMKTNEGIHFRYPYSLRFL